MSDIEKQTLSGNKNYCFYHKRIHKKPDRDDHQGCIDHGHCLNPTQCPKFKFCPMHTGGKNMFLSWSALTKK